VLLIVCAFVCLFASRDGAERIGKREMEEKGRRRDIKAIVFAGCQPELMRREGNTNSPAGKRCSIVNDASSRRVKTEEKEREGDRLRDRGKEGD